MAIQTGTNIASIDALLTAFVGFCVAEAGFTDNGTDTYDGETLFRISRTREALVTHYGFAKDFLPINDDEAIRMRMMSVLPVDANFDDTVSGSYYPTYVGFYEFTFPFAGYTFYTDTDSVFAIVEVRTNIFVHFGLGNMQKCSVFTGGEFLCGDTHVKSGANYNPPQASNNNQTNSYSPAQNTGAGGKLYIRYDVGAGDSNDFTPTGNIDPSQTAVGSMTISPLTTSTQGRSQVTTTVCIQDMFYSMIQNAPSGTTNISPLTPLYMCRKLDGTLWMEILGTVPNIAGVNMEVLNPKDIVNTDWKVYPRSQIGGDITEAPDSTIYGIAYKEIP